MFALIKKLHRTRLLTAAGAFRLLEALLTTGVNLMTILRVAAKLHPQRIAVVNESQRLTYPELWQQAESVAAGLQVNHGVRGRQESRDRLPQPYGEHQGHFRPLPTRRTRIPAQPGDECRTAPGVGATATVRLLCV